jgi:predicted ArsR family transcriptional regulator
MTSHSEPRNLWTPSRQTSHEAYESVKPAIPSIQERIASLLKARPMTDDEMETILELPHQTVSACRRGMVKAGRVEATGDRAKTRSGRSAQTWRLTVR